MTDALPDEWADLDENDRLDALPHVGEVVEAHDIAGRLCVTNRVRPDEWIEGEPTPIRR